MDLLLKSMVTVLQSLMQKRVKTSCRNWNAWSCASVVHPEGWRKALQVWERLNDAPHQDHLLQEETICAVKLSLCMISSYGHRTPEKWRGYIRRGRKSRKTVVGRSLTYLNPSRGRELFSSSVRLWSAREGTSEWWITMWNICSRNACFRDQPCDEIDDRVFEHRVKENFEIVQDCSISKLVYRTYSCNQYGFFGLGNRVRNPKYMLKGIRRHWREDGGLYLHSWDIVKISSLWCSVSLVSIKGVFFPHWMCRLAQYCPAYSCVCIS